MEGDIFTGKNNISENNNGNENFFMKPGTLSMQKFSIEPTKHLNDYDFNILDENAYKDINDNAFRLEYKITKLEDDINELDKQMQAAYDIDDYERAGALSGQKQILQKELEDLCEEYNRTSLSTKISGGFVSNIKNKFIALKSGLNKINDIMLAKIPGKLSTFVGIKNSLDKLQNISKNVDELMSLQTPYGEAAERYEQLSRYITKANSIQAEIARYMK